MFDFSWAQIILIIMVGIIFVGPKDLPKVVRWVADVIKKCRKFADEFQSQMDEMVKDPDLKEAKDQLMKLRHLNVKSAIFNAIDQDGSIQDSFKQSSFSQTLIASSSHTSEINTAAELPCTPLNAEFSLSNKVNEKSIINIELLQRKNPLPVFFPPETAKRILIRKFTPHPPAMIPPYVTNFKEQRWL